MVTLKDDLPEVYATIGLYTANEICISEYSLQTNGWDDNKKFELPPSLIVPILNITACLEHIVAIHCQSSQRLLGEVINGN